MKEMKIRTLEDVIEVLMKLQIEVSRLNNKVEACDSEIESLSDSLSDSLRDVSDDISRVSHTVQYYE